MIMDLCIGLGIPAIFMSLYYIYQGNRYNILEDYGCISVPYNTPMAFALDYSWPLVIGIISGIYGILAVRALRRRQSEFNEALSQHSNLNSNRYFRLMALAFTDVLFTIPIASYFLWANLAETQTYGWSWDSSHWGFDRVDTFPAVIWQPAAAGAFEVARWVSVLGAFIFFGFFGFSEEARRHYYPLFVSSMRVFGISVSGMSFNTMSTSRGTRSAGASVPAFRGVSRKVEKRVSVTSFSSDISFDGTSEAKDVELSEPKEVDVADVESLSISEPQTPNAAEQDLSSPPGFDSNASEKV
jgi:pheromone a factor receptor